MAREWSRKRKSIALKAIQDDLKNIHVVLGVVKDNLLNDQVSNWSFYCQICFGQASHGNAAVEINSYIQKALKFGKWNMRGLVETKKLVMVEKQTPSDTLLSYQVKRIERTQDTRQHYIQCKMWKRIQEWCWRF